MLSIRRVLALIVIILFIVPFALWESSSFDLTDNPETAPIPEKVNLIKHSNLDTTQGYKFLIIGKDDNVVTKNIVNLFEQQHLTYLKQNTATWKDFQDKDMVIICEKEISETLDLEIIEAYISDGGNVLFANGITEFFVDSYLNPILGIEHKTTHFVTSELKIANGFFVVDEENMNYRDFNSSVWLTLRNSSEIYISDKETSLPVVYSYQYKQGKSLVVNGTLLDNPNNMGIVTALMCKGLENFAYPIIGKSLTYLDNISDIAYNDDLTIAEHGMDSSALVLDKLMPELISLALKNDFPYTTSLLAVSSNPESILKTDLTTTWNIAKQLLNYGGEITLSGNFEQDNYIINNQMLNDFKDVFPNYQPNAFMISSGKHTSAIDNYIRYIFPELSMLRYNETLDISGFESTIPSLTYGLDLEGGEKWIMINNLTSMGLFSHRMDLRKLAGFTDDEISFREMMEDLWELSSIYKATSWLDAVTISNAIPSMKSYKSLEFTQQNTENGYVLEINNFIQNQKFMLYSEKPISKVIGGKIQSVNGNYYIIECNESSVNIKYD